MSKDKIKILLLQIKTLLNPFYFLIFENLEIRVNETLLYFNSFLSKVQKVSFVFFSNIKILFTARDLACI